MTGERRDWKGFGRALPLATSHYSLLGPPPGRLKPATTLARRLRGELRHGLWGTWLRRVVAAEGAAAELVSTREKAMVGATSVARCGGRWAG